VRDWADERADVISVVAIGVGIGPSVAAMFTPLGPIAAIAVMAGAGAALSGRLSIPSNKERTERWTGVPSEWIPREEA